MYSIFQKQHPIWAYIGLYRTQFDTQLCSSLVVPWFYSENPSATSHTSMRCGNREGERIILNDEWLYTHSTTHKYSLFSTTFNNSSPQPSSQDTPHHTPRLRNPRPHPPGSGPQFGNPSASRMQVISSETHTRYFEYPHR